MTTVTFHTVTGAPIAMRPSDEKGLTRAPIACTNDLYPLSHVTTCSSHREAFSRNELSEEEHEKANIVLVLYCSATRSIFAHAVPTKALDPN